MTDLFDLPFEEETGAGARAVARSRSTAADGRADAERRTPTPSADRSRRARRVFSVTELTVRVRDLLEAEFFEVWVEGELSNCRVWNTGHLYFTLKDGASQIRGVIFRSALRYLKFKPADGLRVVARGRVSVYEPKGEYQLVCEHLEPHGLGALQLAFDQLKKRLQAEGLFDAARKRPLPALPRKIGIVTSLDGAAIRDIIKVLRRRYANAHLVIRPARVQGEDAAPEIARALRQIARVPGVDVVIVGRGGGSIEDLWAFNEEIVARAIARVAGAGHLGRRPRNRRDDCRLRRRPARADAVGRRRDRRRGEGRVLRPDRSPATDRLRARGARARPGPEPPRAHRRRPAGVRRLPRPRRDARPPRRRAVARARAHHARRPRRRASGGGSSSSASWRRSTPGRRLAGIRTRLVGVATAGSTARVRRRQHRAAAQLGNVAGRLDTLSPLAVLGRGYAVAWNADRTRVLRDAAAVAPGDTVHVTLVAGRAGLRGPTPTDQTSRTPETTS